jgi:hypothetical protein
MLEAAARELRRAHRLWCGEFDDLWSHGDPHLGNVIYDNLADRARLIDFEATHLKSFPAVERQADDLLVFLQDMGGRVPAEQWLPFALDFINTYDRPEVVAELRKHLIIPGGLPGLWWKLRSHYLARTELISRFAALERALERSLSRRAALGDRFRRARCGVRPWNEGRVADYRDPASAYARHCQVEDWLHEWRAGGPP